MSHLTIWQLDAGTLQGIAESVVGRLEKRPSIRTINEHLLKIRCNRDVAITTILAHVSELAWQNVLTAQRLCLAPPRTCCQADTGNDRSTVVVASLQLIKKLLDLAMREIRKLTLDHLQSTDSGERVGRLPFTKPGKLIEDRTQVGMIVVDRAWTDAIIQAVSTVARENLRKWSR